MAHSTNPPSYEEFLQDYHDTHQHNGPPLYYIQYCSTSDTYIPVTYALVSPPPPSRATSPDGRRPDPDARAYHDSLCEKPNESDNDLEAQLPLPSKIRQLPPSTTESCICSACHDTHLPLSSPFSIFLHTLVLLNLAATFCMPPICGGWHSIIFNLLVTLGCANMSTFPWYYDQKQNVVVRMGLQFMVEFGVIWGAGGVVRGWC